MRFLPPLALLLATCTITFATPLPWPFDMRVEQVTSDAATVQVTTTGATFELRAKAGEIAFSQRLSARRPLGVLVVSPEVLHGLRVIARDDDSVKLRTNRGLVLTIACDSVLRLDCRGPLSTTVNGSFAPEYLRVERYGALALDTLGGFGVYPVGANEARPTAEQSAGAFSVRQDLPAHSTLLIGVCPPRQYNWKQHREERIVHQFPRELRPGLSDRPLPTDEELVAWRKMGNVLVLHLEFWDGFGVKHIKPKDPARFSQVVHLAHRLGYLVLPYSSPFYYTPALAPDGKLRPDAVALYLQEAKWLLEEYNVDGLYWDGEFMDVLKAWDCIRQMRQLLGSRRLYVHCTTNPLPLVDLYCPFVNTWADYLLRGEGLRRDHVDPLYLRYVVSGYNISNAIGELCYENCRVDKTVFDWALQANVRIPYWPGLQVHSGARYFLLPEEDKEFRDYYRPAADRIRGPRDLASLAAEGLRQRQARQAEAAARRAANQAALARYLADQKQKLAGQAAGNLAAFKGGECSDWVQRETGPHGLGYPLEYATDQSPDTYWGADGLPQWLTIDLAKTESISRVWVLTYFEDRRYYHYRVEVSQDNKDWRQVGEKMDDALATAAGETYRFASCEARYVRVTILYNSANNAGHIAEIGVYR